MPALVVPTVVPQGSRALGDFIVVGRKHAAVAADGHVLRRVETERADVGSGAGDIAVPTGEVCLTAVRDDGEVVLGGDGPDRVHVRHLPVDVDREHGPWVLRNGGLSLQVVDIHRIRLWVNIDEYRFGVQRQHWARRCEERVSRKEYLTACPDIGGLQSEQNRCRPAADTDSVVGTTALGELRLECFEVFSLDVPRAFEYLTDAFDDRIVNVDVGERDRVDHIP